MKASDRLIKAVEKLNADIKAFAEETGCEMAELYEDANTERVVSDFHLCKNGKLTWKEESYVYTKEGWKRVAHKEDFIHIDEEDVRETIAFWRANLRRAKRYWSMDIERLDRIQDGEIEDEE